MQFATAALQTFKFYRMKKLSRSEMKNVKGGNVPEDGGGCKTNCYHYDSNGTSHSGTCSAGTTTVGNTTVTTCNCSISSATSCY